MWEEGAEYRNAWPCVITEILKLFSGRLLMVVKTVMPIMGSDKN